MSLGYWETERTSIVAQIGGPEAFDVAHEQDMVAAHLCRNDLVCINPFHVTLVPQYVNVSHHGCKYGSRDIPRGSFKPCRM